MARFARDCIVAMNDLTKKLEVVLGPDTGDLSMRVGLHSGPVTAGVLRGDKSRFQLFGDTVNTAARMESLGIGNRIHASRETAELLKMGGKAHWIIPRNDQVAAKGKGLLQTFFLEIKKQSSGSHTSAKSANSSEGEIVVLPHLPAESTKAASGGFSLDHLEPHLRRIVEWNSDILLRFLKQIVARRNAEAKHGMSGSRRKSLSFEYDPDDSSVGHKTVLDEVKEIIVLPEFDAKVVRDEEDLRQIVLPSEVVMQTKEFVTVVASLYHADNPFHNVSLVCVASNMLVCCHLPLCLIASSIQFEHASHVTMSVIKLLSRIVAPEDVLQEDDAVVDKRLHDHTYGITSDPLTQFAVAFSALIHDVGECSGCNPRFECQSAKNSDYF